MWRKTSETMHEKMGESGDILRGFVGLLDGRNEPWWPLLLVSRLLCPSHVMRLFGLLIPILIMAAVRPGLAQANDVSELRRWQWGKSTCFACPIRIVTPKSEREMQSPEAQAFFRAIEDEKPTLMALFGVDGQQYNLLAHMAVGILGQESRFFQSELYHLKERIPLGVRILKRLRIMKERIVNNRNRPMTVNSRGPTQIKEIPDAIREHYKFNEDQLGVPRNAAVATMGFLIRALRQLRTRIANNQLSFVNSSNYVDYLPYLYFGSRQMLLDGKAEPDRNVYVRNMKAWMNMTLIYELDSEPSAIGEIVSRQSTNRAAQ